MGSVESFFLDGKNNMGVLLCHTLAGEPSQMLEIGKKLNKQGYTVSCPLYAGHGKRFFDVINSEVTDWYLSVLDAYDELSKKVDGIYVIGMSIGGTFAVKLAQEKDLKGLITINAPIIGFDIENDIFTFVKNGGSKDLIPRYREHRTNYFKFVVELGQIHNVKKIACPLFVLQGSLDLQRYKTSTQMLMHYVSSEKKQRRDYSRSFHLLLQDNDKKAAMKDIIAFIKEN